MVSATATTIARSRPRVDVDGRHNDAAPPSSYVPPSVVDSDPCDHSNISVFRAQQLEIHVHSPSVKMVNRGVYGVARPLPLFNDHEHIQGSVHLDPKLLATPGRLTITMEGAFIFISPTDKVYEDFRKHRHLFFSSSVSFASGENGSPRSSLREALTAVRHRKPERKPSLPEMSPHPGHRQPFPFSFQIPRPTRPGEELPPTFSSMSVGSYGVRGRVGVERAEVEYVIVAQWESADLSERSRVNAPILYEPEKDFQSLDALSAESGSWLEIPLRSDRPVPFKCALTLPIPSTFSRSGSIPYFVVFTTKPRSTQLAREIAVDATIAVSLLRQVTVLTSRSPPTHSSTSSMSSSTSSEDLFSSTPATRRFLKRVHKSASPIFGGSPPSAAAPQAPKDKPLPELPPQPGVAETRTLQTDVSIGFPKRPRGKIAPHQKHPTLDAHAALPDGLFKGKMQLDKNMLPSIDWTGLSVKYFLEVSVLFGQDESRARIPIRVV